MECFPESWSAGRLTIDCDGRAINYKLKNEHSPDRASLSGALRNLCEELYTRMAQDGNVWTEAVVDLAESEDGWNLKTSFTYPEAPTRSPLPDAKLASAEPRKKRFWNRG